MALTTAQLQTLKTDIASDPALNAQPQNSDGAFAIMLAYNLPAAPNFTVWKTAVALTDIGNAINATELVGLTTGKLTQLQTVLLFGNVNPSIQDRREAFDQIFSAASGTITRPALLALWKRLAKRGEKLFAVGTGSDASPATMTFEGNITSQDVLLARSLP